ncbi:small ribosomal subunit protein mS27-like [Diadema setosum]|uniref:small ribosomal subunit protein mS27-like n=1 Tax=Diadema setosum TaxID=31175 RepID=UPI003B3BA96E
MSRVYSQRLPSFLSLLMRKSRIFCAHDCKAQPTRTLLSDAYHANDTWINRERIIVDMDELKINLDRSFYDLREPVLSVELHKYIDNVYDRDELDVAADYLYSYRHSPVAHHLRQSTVHSWLRLCMELGFHEQALKVLQNKRDYGLFPDNYTYNLLLDIFLRENDIKGACDVAIVMMREETLENCHLSQLLALHACHAYMKREEICQEERWDIGMTLADSTRDVKSTLAASYHVIGHAMTGRLDRAVKTLQSVCSVGDIKICSEVINRLETEFSTGDASEDLQVLFQNTVQELTNQNKVSSEGLDELMEQEMTSRLPALEEEGVAGYTALLEKWHQEHIEALEQKRLAALNQERVEKEMRLDQLQRAVGGIKYWEKDIEAASAAKHGETAGREQAENS